MVNEAKITPVVLLNKNDLLSSEEIQQKSSQIQKIFPRIQIISYSNINYSGMEEIINKLTAGGTFCLLGSSGVGKTSLLNNLLSENRFETKNIKKKIVGEDILLPGVN